jgi:hypothetical protein
MNQVISARRHSGRRSLIAAVTVATLGVVALGVSSPMDASARPRCNPGELCLYSGKNLTGGIYHFSGSDANLYNDRFSGFFGSMVAEHANSVWNNGRARGSGGFIDVALYTRTGFKGNAYCIPLGRRGDLTVTLISVGSYQWVTRATCNTMDIGIGK